MCVRLMVVPFSNHIVNNSTYPDAVVRKNKIQI